MFYFEDCGIPKSSTQGKCMDRNAFSVKEEKLKIKELNTHPKKLKKQIKNGNADREFMNR